MAYERVSDLKIQGEGLDAFIEISLKNFQRQLAIRNADDELRFVTAVLENNLSLEDQLGYRNEQLKRISDDPEERKRIRKEIATLKDRVEAKRFSDEYTSKLIEFESGASSLDAIIGWLRDRKNSTTDDAIKDEIDKQLVTQERARFTLQSAVLEAQTNYALKDKSPQIINEQISRVNQAKNNALLSGNNQQVALFDIQIKSLEKARIENSIDSAAKNFAVSTMSGYLNATGLLDEYNKKVNGASNVGAFSIGGVTYNSEKEFWTFKRDSYIADDSANGLFNRLSTEQNNLIKTRASQNLLSNDDITKSVSAFSSLSARPELQTYAQKIDIYKQNVIQTGVDLRSKSIQNQYTIDFDVNKAVNSLNQLKSLGGNVDEATTNVLTEAAEIKTTQVSNILGEAKRLIDEEGIAPDQALDEAIKRGAGAVYSPGQYATTSEEDIVKGQAKATGGLTSDPRTTVKPETTVKTSQVSGANTPPAIDPAKQGEELSKSGRYYLDSNNNRDVIDTQTGKPISQTDFQNLNLNVALMPKRPGPSTPTPTPPIAPTPTAPPAPTTTPTPKSSYTGTSVVDYLKSIGQDYSYTYRAKLAGQKGIQGYTGTAEQNLKLLNTLRGS